MYDRENFKRYVGGNSGDSYIAGLKKVEEEFNISVPDDKAEGLKTVGDIAAFIDETVGNNK